MKLYDIAMEIEEKAYWYGGGKPLDDTWVSSDLSNRNVRIRFGLFRHTCRMDGRGWALQIKRGRVSQTWGNRDRMMEDLLLYKLSM